MKGIDATDTAQLSIFIHAVDNHFKIIEEWVVSFPTKDAAKAAYLYTAPLITLMTCH
jgi:hypothetical protein